MSSIVGCALEISGVDVLRIFRRTPLAAFATTQRKFVGFPLPYRFLATHTSDLPIRRVFLESSSFLLHIGGPRPRRLPRMKGKDAQKPDTAQADSVNQPAEFKYFLDLPTEICIEIYNHALPTGFMIAVWCTSQSDTVGCLEDNY